MMDDLLQEMIDPVPQRADTSRWRRFGATAAIFALAGLGITSLTTSALFTDRESTPGDLLTGTVDLSLGTFGFTMPTGGLAPGGIVAQAITVTNSGSLELRYAVSYLATAGVPPTGTAGTGDLRTVLTLEVFHVADEPSCSTTALLPTDATLWGKQTGLMASAMTPILGDPTVGLQPGDSVMGGGATVTQTLCVRVSMPATADNTFQNTAAHVSLQFDAEQVVNNP